MENSKFNPDLPWSTWLFLWKVCVLRVSISNRLSSCYVVTQFQVFHNLVVKVCVFGYCLFILVHILFKRHLPELTLDVDLFNYLNWWKATFYWHKRVANRWRCLEVEKRICGANKCQVWPRNDKIKFRFQSRLIA